MPSLDGLSLEWLATESGVPLSRLSGIASKPRRHYQREDLVRPSGKTRVLHKPSFELKAIQRTLLRRVFRRIPRHPCSACVKGKGTIWAYQRHTRHRFLLRLDLANFFPSVKLPVVVDGLVRKGASPEFAELLGGLVTLPNRLPQGAPTSVAVGDIVLGRLDGRLEGLARSRGLAYTRYVDDLTFSGGKRVVQIEKQVSQIVAECGWALNEKGGVFGPGERHGLLGAVVNQKPNASREYFGEIRSFLRLLSSKDLVLGPSELNRLRGRVNWILKINPERTRALEPLLRRAEELAESGLTDRSRPTALAKDALPST